MPQGNNDLESAVNDGSENPLSPHEVFLAELHGVSPLNSQKNKVLLIEFPERARDSIREDIKRLLPNHEVIMVSEYEHVIDALDPDIFQQTAVIVDHTGVTKFSNFLSREPGKTLAGGVFFGDELDFPRIPIVGNPSRGVVDGKLVEPSRIECLDGAIAEAINSKLTIFAKQESDVEENEARERVLQKFIDYFKSEHELWAAFLEEYKDVIRSHDFDAMSDTLAAIQEIIENLGHPSEISTSQLRDCLHDINNKLVIIFGYLTINMVNLGDDPAVEGLKSFEKKVKLFGGYARAIQLSYKGDYYIKWSDIDSGNLPNIPVSQKLELTRDCNICLVDDDPLVLKHGSAVISKAGGKPFSALDGMEIFQLKSKGEEVDVFLLDHDLGNKFYGYELIPLIRTSFPGAKIILHTGDADKLNQDPSNIYAREGISIVRKFEWNRISQLI